KAPWVHDVRIGLAVRSRIGQQFAAARDADVCAVNLAGALLQLCAVTLFVVTESIKHAHAGHVRATPEFDVVSAREIVLAVKFPPRYVHVHSADAVVIVRWNFLQRRDVAVAVTTDGVGEISADSAGGVSDTVWKGGGFGVQQEARGFAGACGHDNRARVYALLRTRRFVNLGARLRSALCADKHGRGQPP